MGLRRIWVRPDQEMQKCGRMCARLIRLDGLVQLFEVIDCRHDPRIAGILPLPNVGCRLQKFGVVDQVVVRDGAAVISRAQRVDSMTNLDSAEMKLAKVRVERR
jgi:hypothetical protein